MTSVLPRALFISYIVLFSIFSISSFISFSHCKIFQQVKNDSRTLEKDTFEKVSTAYHEAGHVLVAYYLNNAPKIVSVTVVPKKGAYLGRVLHEFMNESHATKDEFLDYIALCMGGRAAIEIQYGPGDQVDVGAGKDVENATNAASEMVEKFGLSHKLGITKLFDDTHNADTKEEMLKEEIGDILEDAFIRAKKVIKEHRNDLEDLVEKLLAQDTLMASEVIELFDKSAAIRNSKMMALLNIIGK